MTEKWYHFDPVTGEPQEVVTLARKMGKTERMRQAAEAKGYKAGLRKAAEMAEGEADEWLKLGLSEGYGALRDLIARLRALAEKE